MGGTVLNAGAIHQECVSVRNWYEKNGASSKRDTQSGISAFLHSE